MIKKRFLLKDEGIEAILDAVDSVKVEEFYTHISPCKKIKYINFDGGYFKKKSVGSSKKNKTKKKIISKKKFDKNKKCSMGKTIKKNLYQFDDKNRTTVHSFSKTFENLNILTVKFKTIKKLDEFKNSDIYSLVKEDITNVDSFRDTSLVLLGNPLTMNYNVYKLFKEIEINKNLSIKNLIHNDMKVDDALRVKLYELYINLNQQGSEILVGKEKNQLISYTKSINKIVTILEEFKEYFDIDLHERVINNLVYIKKHCDIQKDLKPIKNSLEQISDCLGKKRAISFLRDFDANITLKSQSFKKFLQTREYSIIMKQLELLIKESSYNSINATHYKSIKVVVEQKIKTGYKKSLKTIDKNFDCSDYDNFQKITTGLDKLMILIDEFKFLSKESNFFKSKKSLLKVKSSFNQYLRVVDRNTIIQDKIDNLDSIKCLKNDFYNNSDNLINQIEKDIKQYKKQDGLFK